MRSIIRFLSWFAANTRLLYCFLVALLIHVALLAACGWITFGAARPRTVAVFDASTVPPPVPPESAVNRTATDRDYDIAALGAGGGTGGKGLGGVPTPGGSSLEAYHAHLATASSQPSPDSIDEVIGVVGREASAVPRPTGGPTGVGLTSSGLGDTAIGIPGVKGPGGGVLNFRMGLGSGRRLNQSGGSTNETERAVLAALRWLAAHQEENGSWRCGRSTAAGTALATLAFLGHGETPDSVEFGNTVGKALEYLSSHIGSDGLVSESSGDYIGSGAQGMVVLALSQAYAVTPSPRLRDPLERAVRTIVRAQSAPKASDQYVGGWRYRPTSDDSDVSVTGWMVLALTSAKAAGLDVPREVTDRAAHFLWNMYDVNNPGFGYQSPERSPSMTAIGVFCQQVIGNGIDPRIKPALDYLREEKADWDKTQGDYVLYGWFYITQAMSRAGGSYWNSWDQPAREVLIKMQRSDGRWMPPPNSTMEIRDLADTPAYSTALAVLILETDSPNPSTDQGTQTAGSAN